MNSIHDLGGMQNLGPINIEENEPVFHEQWEKDVLAIAITFFTGGVCAIDHFRHDIEKMPPADYLTTSYYEHWLFALEMLGIEHNLFTAEELEAKMKTLAEVKS
jgi:nitrile hydratase